MSETTAQTLERMIKEYEVAPVKSRISINWETDFNKKLGCNAMIHLAPPPVRKRHRSEIEATVITIHTKDKSQEPSYWRLIDISQPMRLWDVPLHLTLASHGMDPYTFIKQFLDNNEQANRDTPLVLYYYVRCSIDG